MKQLPSELIVFKRIDKISEFDYPKGIFSIRELDYKQEVRGVILDVCFSVKQGYLVITSDDCIYENTIYIQLLNPQLDIIDQVLIGLPYATGIFKLINIESTDRIVFEFFKDELYELTLLDKPEFKLPFISEAQGVFRRFGFQRYFKIITLC